MICKQIYKLLYCMLLCGVCTGCTHEPDYADTAGGNFDAVWNALDRNYCYFKQKGIDWEGVRRVYEPRALACRDTGELFDVCAQMLDTLADGHVNLVSQARTSYYRKWWADYPQDFNLRTVQEHYLHFNWLSAGGIVYSKLCDGKAGYIYYGSFNTSVSENALDGVLGYFSDCRGLIIDVRNNGGGLLTNVDTWVGRFIDVPLTGGYIRHKTGPGHDDFSEPYAMEYKPAPTWRVHWRKPVVVLTNRSCFSAANDFVSVMKCLSGVRICGAVTGGGGGLPFSSETPCGWSIRFSACPVTDVHGQDIEEGISPSPGCEMHSPDAELAAGVDAILDFALHLIGGTDVEE